MHELLSDSDEKLTEKISEVKLSKNITIYAKWIEKSSKANNPFTDVAEDSYYYDAVLWAVQGSITYRYMKD